MKSFAILSLLLVLSSLPPSALSEDYSSFETTQFECVKIDEQNYCKTTITNTGNDYIDISGCYIDKNDFNLYPREYYYELIAPGKSKEVYFINKNQTLINVNELKIKAFGDVNTELISVKSFGQKSVENKQRNDGSGEAKNYFEYTIEFSYEVLKEFDHYYSLGFTVSYLEEEHSYFLASFSKEENPYKLVFDSDIEIEPNSIDVKDVFLFKGNSYYDDYLENSEKQGIKNALIGAGLATLLVVLVIAVVLIFRKLFNSKKG